MEDAPPEQPASYSSPRPSDQQVDGETGESEILSDNQASTTIIAEAEQEQYPSDRANFPVDLIDPDVKRRILALGSCKPGGPFPRDHKNRCFSEDYYFIRSKLGCKVPRKWICYSPKMDRAYCEPCWLFADRRCPSHQLAWTVGIKDWQGLSGKIKTHQSSKSHLAACVVFDHWKNDRTVDTQFNQQYKHELDFWTQVLKRVTDVTLTLASCKLSFRAHREKIGELNSGNFLSVIELLARYDPVLEELLKKKKKSQLFKP